jgi:hypothetical protein
MTAAKRSALLLVFCAWAAVLPSAIAQEEKPPLVPAKVLRSDTVYIDCSVCPKGLAVSDKQAAEKVLWLSFGISRAAVPNRSAMRYVVSSLRDSRQHKISPLAGASSPARHTSACNDS